MKPSVRCAAGLRLPGEAARVRTAAGRPARACLGLALLASVLAALPPAVRAAEDDFVPAGIFRFSAAVSHETQTKAVARDSVNHGLEVYALPNPADARKVTGTLSREINETDLQLQLGLTDRWNVSLAVPYVQAIQHSTLRVNDPAADPALTATVANLNERTVSGMGNFRLTSLHRPIFTDANAVVWGWGFTESPERNTGVYTGTGSLQTRDPYGSLFGLFHFTHYPQQVRGRFDLRAEYILPLIDKVNLPTGQRVSILGAPGVLTSAGWEHEPGAWGYGLRVDQKATLQSRLDGESQEDPVKEWIFHAQLGYGNLIALEAAPIRFPYQVSLTWDATFFAYNAPIRDRWGLLFFTYF
jgi:hypothetical protein